jgi:hypothetical protein
MESQTGSYIEFGLVLHRSVEDLCIQVEKEGWRVKWLRGGKLRYWCDCDKQHQVWIDTAAELLDPRIDFLFNRTCMTFREV